MKVTFLISYVGAFALTLNWYDFNTTRAAWAALGWACGAISFHRLVAAIGSA